MASTLSPCTKGQPSPTSFLIFRTYLNSFLFRDQQSLKQRLQQQSYCNSSQHRLSTPPPNAFVSLPSCLRTTLSLCSALLAIKPPSKPQRTELRRLLLLKPPSRASNGEPSSMQLKTARRPSSVAPSPGVLQWPVSPALLESLHLPLSRQAAVISPSRQETSSP